MDSIPSFNSYIERSIIKNWNLDALTDYKGATLKYHDVARKIEKLHILFENSDVKKGDKIAVCGRNSSQWAVAFLAIITYGAIVVPIQNEFKPEQIHNIVNHSESKLLFVGDVVATEITPEEMPSLEGIIHLPDNSLVISRSEKLTYAREHLNEMFGHKYPKYFRAEHVKYHVDAPEELAMINYTSGTTGFSKGVMLPYRALWGNLDYLIDSVSPKMGKNCNILSTLPMAHMYGLMTEFLYNIVEGNHIFFLTRLPSPTLISEALAEIKPDILFAVPLVVDKIVRKEGPSFIRSLDYESSRGFFVFMRILFSHADSFAGLFVFYSIISFSQKVDLDFLYYMRGFIYNEQPRTVLLWVVISFIRFTCYFTLLKIFCISKTTLGFTSATLFCS